MTIQCIRPVARILPIAGLALACASGAPEDNAPAAARAMFRGGPAHTGVYPRAGNELAGIQWLYTADGDITGSVTVSGGHAYVGDGSGHLAAIDVASGATVWIADAGSPIHSTPAVSDGRVYVATRDGHMIAFAARDGSRAWSFAAGPDLPLAWGHESGDIYLSSPAIEGGRVIVGAGDGRVYALDASSGRQLWKANTNGRVRSSPAIADGRVFVGSMDGLVYALGLESGSTIWTYRTMGADLNSGDFGYDRRTIQSSPAVADGTVFVGARDGVLYAIDAATGELNWRFDHNISWVITSPAVADGVVYAGSSDAVFIQALDAATGQELWRTTIGQPVWSSPVVSGDRLIFGESGGRIISADRQTGAIRWSFRTPAQVFGAPIVHDSLVIAASVDGHVYALRTTDGPAVRRAVFHDTALSRTTWHADPAPIARYFEARGYETMNATALGGFMRDRIADSQPSVIVFAIDHVPASLASTAGPGGLLREYLDAGGKIVWPGIPPLLWPRDSTTGVPATPMTQIGWQTTTKLLDVDHDAAIFGPSGTRVTPAGRQWGIADHLRTAWAVDPAAVTEVLGLTEFGLVGEWVKSYGGQRGTGFVRLEAGDNLSIYHAAEYRPR